MGQFQLFVAQKANITVPPKEKEGKGQKKKNLRGVFYYNSHG
jgi:hypothetical protein